MAPRQVARLAGLLETAQEGEQGARDLAEVREGEVAGVGQIAVADDGGTGRQVGERPLLVVGRRRDAVDRAADDQGRDGDRREEGVGEGVRGRRLRKDRLDARVGEGPEAERPAGQREGGVAAERVARDADGVGVDGAEVGTAGIGVESQEGIDQEAHVERTVHRRLRIDDAGGAVDEGVAVVIGRDDDVAVAGEVGGEEERLDARAVVAVREEHQRMRRAAGQCDVAIGGGLEHRDAEHGGDVARHAGDGGCGRRVVDFDGERTRAGTGDVEPRRVAQGARRDADRVRPELRRRPEVVGRVDAQREVAGAGDGDVGEAGDAVGEAAGGAADQTQGVEFGAAALDDLVDRLAARLGDARVAAAAIASPALEGGDEALLAERRDRLLAQHAQRRSHRLLALGRRAREAGEVVGECQIEAILAPVRARLGNLRVDVGEEEVAERHRVGLAAMLGDGGGRRFEDGVEGPSGDAQRRLTGRVGGVAALLDAAGAVLQALEPGLAGVGQALAVRGQRRGGRRLQRSDDERERESEATHGDPPDVTEPTRSVRFNQASTPAR